MQSLQELLKEEDKFFKHNNMPTEFDQELNDIQRDKVQWARDNWKEVWFGNINKGNILERTDNFIYNFSYAFIVPEFSQKLFDTIQNYREAETAKAYVEVKIITAKIKQLNGLLLHWV